MSDQSKIQWTDATWNPVRGCSKVSQGCANCYAETMAQRFSGPGYWGEGFATRERGWTGKVALIPEKLTEPLRWKKPRKIFVNSMSDLFHEGLPFDHIAAVFGVMAACPQHVYQILTKRPERAVEFFEWMGDFDTRPCFKMTAVLANLQLDYPRELLVSREWPLPNVHIGVSVENQETAEERIPLLLQIPAAVRFLSVEPLLGPVDLRSLKINPPKYEPWHARPVLGDVSEIDALSGEHIRGRFGFSGGTKVDWVIVGGESGKGARPCSIEWIRSIVEQCRDASVPVFVKQLGAVPTVDDTPTKENPFPIDLGEWRPSDRDTMNDVRVLRGVKNRKGGDPSEWPADLRVREFPGERP